MPLQKLRMLPLRLLRRRAWVPPNIKAPLIESERAVEEEDTPGYDPKRFYPMRLGEVLGRSISSLVKSWIWYEFNCVAGQRSP